MYTQLILNRCLDNKYTRWYLSLCENARSRLAAKSFSGKRKEANQKFGYTEAHHILPRSLCLEESHKTDKENLVFLTFREHLIAHALLCKMFSDKSQEKHKMQYACIAFMKAKTQTQTQEQLIELNSRSIERLRKEYISRRKEMSTGKNNPNYGGKYTSKPEVREKMLASAKIRDNTNVGIHERTAEMIELARKNRIGKGTGDRNAMSALENRNKVADSKIGRKLAINISTGKRKYVFPDNIPEGYVLRDSV
jgi:hypothetical protein